MSSKGNKNSQTLLQIEIIRALDKKEYLVVIWGIFFSFLTELYVVNPHLNRLDETVQMKCHNICFYAELTKIIPNYHQIIPLILSSDNCLKNLGV